MADIELNGLNVKSDSLPDNWLMTLVNPVTGAVAENMTVARFIELFISKMPEVTDTTKGLMSPQGLGSNPSSRVVNRKIMHIGSFQAKKAFRIKIEGALCNFNIKLLGGWQAGQAYGILEKVISANASNISGTKVYGCSVPICEVFYISDPYFDGTNVYVDIINKRNGINNFPLLLESFYDFNAFEFTYNQNPRTEDLTKNNRDETEFALSTSIKTFAVSPNALTETIVEEVPVLADTPMMLLKNGQNDLTTQTVERYEYSIPKMAEMILSLRRELDESKGGKE